MPLLAHKSALRVLEVTDGIAVQPNNVYVIPPNARMSVSDGFFQLADRAESGEKPRPIDDFFSRWRSFAKIPPSV